MSDMTIDNPARGVPREIVSAVAALIRRTRTVIVLRGACATATVALSCLLAVMAIDAWLTIFSAWPRWLLSVASLGATVLAAAVFLVRPLVRSFTMTGVARMIESRHPEMHERISSAIELLTSKDRPELRGSDLLIAALAGEATLQAQALQVRREVTLRGARPFILAAVGAAMLLAALLLAWPQKTRQLLARAVAPGANLPNIHASDLVISPGDTTIVQGQALEAAVLVRDARVSAAQIMRLPAEGPETLETMTPAGAESGYPRFAFTCPPAGASFRYRIRAGDALSRYYSVSVVPPPALRQITLQYEYPAYTARPGRIETAAGDIQAVAGTRVRLTFRSNKPLAWAQALIKAPAERVVEATLSGDRIEGTLDLDLTPGLVGRWTLRLADTQGFQSRPGGGSIQALRDEPPVVKILTPQDPALHLGREDRLPLSYTVSDDYGLSQTQLTLKTDQQALPPLPLTPEGAAGRGRAWAGKFLLDLSHLALADARTLTLQVRATDNLPADMKGPQEGLSAPITITLDSAAPSYAMQVQMAHELQIRAVLEEVLKHLTIAKLDSSPLQKVMARLETLNGPALDRIERLRKSLSSAEKPLRELIANISTGSFAPLAIKLTDLTDNHVAKALSLAGGLKLADTVKERAEAADEADFQVDRAIAVVSDMLKSLSVMTELARRMQALSELAQRQQDLAAEKAAIEAARQQAATNPASKPASMPAGALAGGIPPAVNWTPEAQKAWQQRQAQLAAAMNDLVKQTRGALAARATDEHKTTRNLAADARELAVQQAALTTETSQAIQRDQVQAALTDLAKRQGDLAAQTTAESSLKDAAALMTAAATELPTPTDQTAKRLDLVDSQLQLSAAQNQRKKTAVALAGQAQQLSLRQQAAGTEVSAAAKIAQDEQTALEALGKQIADLKTQQTKARETLKTSLVELSRLQRGLAGRSAQAESKVAANPATAQAAAVRPSGGMNATADSLAQGNLLQSRSQAQQSSTQAQDLSQKAAAANQAAQKSAQDPTATAAAARDLQTTQTGVLSGQAVSDTAQTNATAQTAQAAATDQAAKASESANATAQTAAKTAQTAADQRTAQAAAADQVAKKSESDAQAARAAADAAKTANAPDASQKADAAKAAQDKAAADRAAATAAQQQAVGAVTGAAGAKAKAQDAAVGAAKDRALADVAKQKSAAAAAAVTDTRNKLKAAQDALAAATKKQQDALVKKDQLQKQATQAQASADEVGLLAQEQAQLTQKVEQLVTGPGKDLAELETAGQKAQQDHAAHQQTANVAAARLVAQRGAQHELAQQARTIVAGLAQATPEAHEAGKTTDPASKLEQAAQAAGQTQQPAQADQAAQAAQQQTAAFAEALTKSLGVNPPTAAQSDQIANHIAALQQQQGQVHQRGRELLSQNAQLIRQQRQAALSRLRAEQSQLAKAAQDLTDRVKSLAPQADRLDTTVARSTMRASQELQETRLVEAQASAQEAATGLTALAGRLGASAEDLPEPTTQAAASAPAGTMLPADKKTQVVVGGSTRQEPDQVRNTRAIAKAQKKEILAADTAGLARRQQQVAAEVQGLVQDQPKEILVSRQKSIAQRTGELSRDVELLQQHSVELIPQPQIRASAEGALREMTTARAQQQRAQQSLEQKALASALPPQQESAAALHRAAATLEQLGQQLAQEAAHDTPPADKTEQEESGFLAGAAEEADLAARTEEARDAQRAAKLLAELSGLAAARAQQAGVMPLDFDQLMNSRGMMGGFTLRPGGGGQGVAELSPQQLEALGISVTDWARLPGELRDEVLQAAGQSGPEEYRTLIKQYFQEISRRGGAAGAQEKK